MALLHPLAHSVVRKIMAQSARRRIERDQSPARQIGCPAVDLRRARL